MTQLIQRDVSKEAPFTYPDPLPKMASSCFLNVLSFVSLQDNLLELPLISRSWRAVARKHRNPDSNIYLRNLLAHLEAPARTVFSSRQPVQFVLSHLALRIFRTHSEGDEKEIHNHQSLILQRNHEVQNMNGHYLVWNEMGGTLHFSRVQRVEDGIQYTLLESPADQFHDTEHHQVVASLTIDSEDSLVGWHQTSSGTPLLVTSSGSYPRGSYASLEALEGYQTLHSCSDGEHLVLQHVKLGEPTILEMRLPNKSVKRQIEGSFRMAALPDRVITWNQTKISQYRLADLVDRCEHTIEEGYLIDSTTDSLSNERWILLRAKKMQEGVLVSGIYLYDISQNRFSGFLEVPTNITSFHFYGEKHLVLNYNAGSTIELWNVANATRLFKRSFYPIDKQPGYFQNKTAFKIVSAGEEILAHFVTEQGATRHETSDFASLKIPQRSLQ